MIYICFSLVLYTKEEEEFDASQDKLASQENFYTREEINPNKPAFQVSSTTSERRKSVPFGCLCPLALQVCNLHTTRAT
jgi:hypothetical protein